jgi:circadian clock protein KaiC
MSMTTQNKVPIHQLPTGVPGLDDILGGGVPEFSFNILAGSPGSGKTTLAHQFTFRNATPEYPALYFTVLGEPALKMLRYQQQYSFFDVSLVSKAIRFVNLRQVLVNSGLKGVLDEITKQVEAAQPRVVVVDSFNTVMEAARSDSINSYEFVQNLALLLGTWEVTSFLIGEYAAGDLHEAPIFTVADGVIWLYQKVEVNSVVRKLQVLKLRGQRSVPGLHTFTINDAGLETFSRTAGLTGRRRNIHTNKRLSTGVSELDEMLGGGIPEGDSLLIAGSAGTGKSVLAMQFLAAGLREGESAILAVFEEHAEEYVARARTFGLDLSAATSGASLQTVSIRPLDLSLEEALKEMRDLIQKTGAKRLVIDSLAGFEVALAAGFRAEFRESLYRMILSLTSTGITVLSTAEISEFRTESLFSTSISFLADDLIRLRYVEIDGQLRRIMVVVKMRGSSHSKDICEYGITSRGIVLGKRIRGYHHLLTGTPERSDRPVSPDVQFESQKVDTDG